MHEQHNSMVIIVKNMNHGAEVEPDRIFVSGRMIFEAKLAQRQANI
jgi:hypothetical protein